jgi:anti-anti-sigma factor
VLSGDLTGQVGLLAAEAERAVAAGFTGIRVWADVTPLTRDPALLQRFLDFELVIEKIFRERAVTGLCALDVSTAGEHWVRLASRHRLFRVWGDSPMLSVVVHDGVVQIVGEVDLGSLVELEDALDSVARTTRGTLVLDLGEVEFLDVAGARELARFVRRLVLAGREVRVAGATRGLLPEVLSLFQLPTGGDR